jgi:Ca2+-binding RTX toxin-like protein
MTNFNILLNSFQVLFPNLDSILTQALQNTSEYLSNFRNDAGYSQKLEIAFGSDFDGEVANQLFDGFAQGNFSAVPTIEIVNRDDINGANGAFSITTGKVYLAADFINQNAQNVNAIVSVLLEEYGHYVDSRINTKDAAGDEGDIFARLVQGKSISQQELAVLKAEDDSATVTLDSQEINIEQAIGDNSVTFNTAFVARNGDFTLQHGWTSFNSSPRQLADVNGDGRADIVGFATNEIWVSLGQNNGTFSDPFVAKNDYFTPQDGGWNSFDAYPRQVADVNGDGRADIVGFGGDGVYVALSNGTTFNNATKVTGNFSWQGGYWDNRMPRQVADVNGDGRDDIVGFRGDGVYVALVNSDGDDILRGGTGNDTLYGGAGSDILYGGNGDDALDGDLGPAVSGTARDTVYGGAGNDSIWGGEDNDSLFGEDGNDNLIGEDGNDTLYPGYNLGSTDTVDGGSGTDILQVDYSSKTDNAGIHLGYLGTNHIWNIADGQILVNVFNVENYNITGTQYADVFEVGSGNHIFNGGADIDTFDVRHSGTSYVIRLDGQNPGSASSGANNTQLFSIENVIGSNFNDSLYGDGQANRLEGNDGNDYLEGKSGYDVLSGGLGDDTLDGGSEGDRAIETGDVNFTLSIVNIANDTNNTQQLTGLGTDTLRNIETVELQGGASNNTLDASLATVKVKLEGLGGNDTLKGGSGDDTLIGGKGSNNLWGGTGRDTFVIDRSSTSLFSGDIQIIQDFERTVDSIDVAGADLRYITFERNTVDNYTLIKENGVDRAKVLGTTRIDSTDLSKFRTIYQTISANEVGNLDLVIRKWAQNYAGYVGTTLAEGFDVSLTGVTLTQGEVKYDPFTSLSLPNGDTQVMGRYINKSNIQQTSPTFTYTQKASATSNVTVGTSYSQTNTTAIKHGWKIGVGFDYNLTTKVSSKVSAKVGDIGGEIGTETGISKTFKFSGEYSGEHSSTGSFTNGDSRIFSDIKLEENSTQTTYSYLAPAFSVTEFKAISSQTTYSGNYEMDVAIGGNVKFRLADNGKTDDGTNAVDVTVPVALILEQYNPEIFHSQDTNYQNYELLNGDQIVYSPNLEFTVKGTIESQSIYGTQVVTDTTYDILLGGGQNYQAQAGKERLWVATGQLPLAGTAPVKITGFSDGLDKIGFVNVPQIMGLGNLERWNSGTSGFIGIGTGDQRRALAELVGISATALDVTDFIFDATGTAISDIVAGGGNNSGGDTGVLPTITLAVSPSIVTEDGTANLVYTFTRTGATTNALTINYGITAHIPHPKMLQREITEMKIKGSIKTNR